MAPDHHKQRHALSAVLTLAIIIGMIVNLTIAIWTAPQLDLPFIPETPQGSTQLSLFILASGTAVGWTLVISLLYLILDDFLQGKRISALVYPIFLVKVCMVMVTTISTAISYDTLAHSPREWTNLSEPEVRILVNLSLLGVFIGVGWLEWLILRGGRWSRRKTTLIFGSLLIGSMAFGLAVASLRLG